MDEEERQRLELEAQALAILNRMLQQPQSLGARVQGMLDNPQVRLPVPTARHDVPEWVQQQTADHREMGQAMLGRNMVDAIADNVLGRDDGVTSAGENIGSFINRGIESGTLGVIGDEAAALGDNWVRGQDYDEALAQRRATEEQFATDHPVAAITADIVGALVPGLGVLGAASRGTNLFSRGIFGGLAGAAQGGTMGAMEGEGGFANRVANMGVPAAIGGVLGAAAPAVSQAAGAVWNRVGPGIQRQTRAAQRQLGLDRAGAEMVGEAVARDAPVADSLLQRAGPNAVTAQTGPQTLGLLDWAVNRPGPAGTRTSNQVQQFAAERGTDLTRTMDDVLGIPSGIQRAQRGIMDGTRQSRADAYGAAYAAPIDYSGQAGQRIETLLDRVPPQAIRAAEDMMRTEGVQSAQRIARIADDGTVTFDTLPDVRSLDYITRALRDMDDPFSGTGPTQRSAYGALARDIRSTLDEVVPEYRAARAEGRDAIANREATDFGGELMGRGIAMDVAEDRIADMGEAELSYARQGVRSYFDEIMANAQAAMLDDTMDIREAMRPIREIRSRAGERKLVALLGEDAASELLRSADAAYSALNLRASVAPNSRTAMRGLAEDRLDAAYPVGGMEALQDGRGLLGSLTTAAQGVNGSPAAARLAARDQVSDNIASLLMRPANGGGSPLPTIRQLPGLLERSNAQRNALERGVGSLNGLLAATGANQFARN